MRSIFSLAFLVLLVSLTHSLPQFFGQSFSSSSFVGPNGQVIQTSAYEDSQGNRVINGIPTFQQQPEPQIPAQPAPTAAPARPVATRAPAAKPANTDINSGQYVPDDRGKWKGN